METPPPLPDSTLLRPAGFWIRLLASIIDTVVLSVPLLPLLWIFYGTEILRVWHGASSFDFTAINDLNDIQTGPVDLFVEIGVALLIIILWRTVRGTPGKLLLGLRVVDARTGKNLSWARSTVRYLGYFVSLFPFFLGFFWVAFDPRKRGFHDKLAGSLVVHSR